MLREKQKKLVFAGIFGMFLLLTFLTAPEVQAARIHGNIYGPDLNLLKGLIVEVNSTPKQSLVAADGAYSFELAPGTYIIEAIYSEQDLLFYVKEEINIIEEGTFVHDLILFEMPEVEELEFNESELALIEELLKEKETSIGIIIISIITIIIIIGIAAAYLLYKYRKLKSKKQTKQRKSKNKRKKGEIKKKKIKEKIISPDKTLNKVFNLVKKEKRITQKELRKKIGMSEAKISLIITDLEDRGLVRKIKRGRGNIIIKS